MSTSESKFNRNIHGSNTASQSSKEPLLAYDIEEELEEFEKHRMLEAREEEEEEDSDEDEDGVEGVPSTTSQGKTRINMKGKKRARKPDVVRKPRATTSEAWKYFEKTKGADGKQKAKCNWCGSFLKAESVKNGMSGLWKHIGRCKLNPENLKKQSLLKFSKPLNADGNEAVSFGQWKFNNEAARRSIAIMIILDELPFSFVEKPGFLQFCETCLPPTFKPPSRRTVTRDVLALYCEFRDDLKKYFKDKRIRVSLTTDTWTSQGKISFMSLTAHYIDENWKLHKKIISFVPVDSHKGDDLGEMLERCLREWGIDKIYCLTVDNASANDVLVRSLQACLNKWGTSVLKGKDLQMRSAAHISNLVVQDGIKLHDESVERVRAACKWVRQSPLRIKAFKEALEFEKIDFKKNLITDVPHRWNSCYEMLERAEKYELAFARLEKQDKSFKSDLSCPNGPGLPNDEDWARIRRVIAFLRQFYLFTLRISGSTYCTSNLLLNELCDIHDAINQWSDMADIDFVLMATNMREKFEKYWGDPTKMNKNIFFAMVLDPSQKMRYLNFLLVEMYKEKGNEYAVMIEKEMRRLFQFYKTEIQIEMEQTDTTVSSFNRAGCSFRSPKKSKKGGDQGAGGGSTMTESRSCSSEEVITLIEPERIFKKSEKWKKWESIEVQETTEKSELDKYLDEQVEKRGEGDDLYDVLSWWKLHEPRFPILAAMARDILAIPISTVASESAFSTSGRVLDDFRSSLTPKITQALICSQDWMKPRKRYVNDIENIDDLEEAEQEYRKKFRASVLDN